MMVKSDYVKMYISARNIIKKTNLRDYLI